MSKPLTYYPIITQGVHSQSEFTRKCYLNVLRHVIKVLAARRLINQRQVFFDITTSLFVYMVQLWNTHLQAAMEQLSAGNAESAVDTLHLACVCLKSEYMCLVIELPSLLSYHATINLHQCSPSPDDCPWFQQVSCYY